MRFSNKWYQSQASSLTIWVKTKQNDVVSTRQMVLHVRRVPERSERNLGLMGGSVKLGSRVGLLGVHPNF